jgi:hypothetical protein
MDDQEVDAVVVELDLGIVGALDAVSPEIVANGEDHWVTPFYKGNDPFPSEVY